MAAELTPSHRMEPQALRALIGRNKQSDKIFAIVGLLAMLVGVFALIWLLVGSRDGRRGAHQLAVPDVVSVASCG